MPVWRNEIFNWMDVGYATKIKKPRRLSEVFNDSACKCHAYFFMNFWMTLSKLTQYSPLVIEVHSMLVPRPRFTI